MEAATPRCVREQDSARGGRVRAEQLLEADGGRARRAERAELRGATRDTVGDELELLIDERRHGVGHVLRLALEERLQRYLEVDEHAMRCAAEGVAGRWLVMAASRWQGEGVEAEGVAGRGLVMARGAARGSRGRWLVMVARGTAVRSLEAVAR